VRTTEELYYRGREALFQTLSLGLLIPISDEEISSADKEDAAIKS
jgi:hypothetical protein